MTWFPKQWQFPVPIVKKELSKTASSQYYASFDFTHSNWQVPREHESQKWQSSLAPDDVYTPTRIFNGTTNAVIHLQTFLTMNLAPELKEHTQLWVGDYLFLGSTVDTLLKHIRLFLAFCANHNWNLQLVKCVLYSTSVKGCGQIITADGIRHDLSKLEGLIDMDYPTTSGQLQHCMCAMHWLRSSIPQLQDVIIVFDNFPNHVYSHVCKRTKLSVALISLVNLDWMLVHSKELRNAKKLWFVAQSSPIAMSGNFCEFASTRATHNGLEL